jgi:multidrug efflux pump
VFSRFFIDRPIFASVMSIVITLTGAVAVFNLPLAQYPQITPPSIIVQCTYPGASAQVVAESVAAPIEQQVNGVEDMIYMSSQSANDGSYSLSVTFKPGVNLNFAQVLVQNRVNLALPLLPDVVKQTGVTTRKRNPDILLIVSVYSPHDRYNQLYLSNFATLQIADELKRVDGVGDVFLFGQQDYSMRIWVDPDRLASLNLTAGDVVSAIREQNQQVATGQIGQQPTAAGRPFEFTLTTLGRLSDPQQFENIILRTTADGRKVHIKDVGYVRLGARNQDVTSKIDGHDCTSLAIFQLPYANALATAQNVRAKMDDLKRTFPEDIEFAIAFDTTPFISESIREVFRTLAEAVILVAIIVLLFLQNWRSTIIPLVAVPVAIVGTFAAMAAIGFSLNNLTLFGLVLAIGIVVDDAIVVVEAVEHHIEEGMSPRQAAYRAMEEVSGPVVAVALVLSAVFIPCAFISGITGQFFRQFALTIAVSTIISAFNSLTLSPALAALLLRPLEEKARTPLPRLAFVALGGWLGFTYLAPQLGPGLNWLTHQLPVLSAGAWHVAVPWTAWGIAVLVGATAGWFIGPVLNWLLSRFFGLFNLAFHSGTTVYRRVVGLALRGSALVLLVYGGLLVLTYWGFAHLPTGYIPNQDQGRLYAAIQLPDSSSLARTQEVVDRVATLAAHTRGVAHTLAIGGQSFTLSANGSNFGNIFITLEPFDERHDPDLYSEKIAARLKKQIAAEVPEAIVTILGPPPVSGLGSSGGFKFIVEDRSGDGDLNKLQQQTDKLIAASKIDRRNPPPDGAPQTKLSGLFTVFRANTPQLYVDLNRDQCQTMGVNPNDVFTTLQVYLGSLYVNDFNKFGRTWQVVVQAEGPFRNDVEKVKRLKVRNTSGDMVPLGSVLTVKLISGPILLTRYNMYPAAAIVGNTRPGVSTGEGIDAMQRLAEQTLPKSMGYEWTEISFIQVDASKNIWNNLIFPLAVVFVFLVLAAQYESWALPLAVILVVPMCILGSLSGVYFTHSDINIFTQIGFVVLVGLASKNAILIVEFAKLKRETGLSRYEATLEAVRLRLRPILMTSFAFILGVVPLMLATGAGAEMRRTLGTAVFSGMLGVTLFGVFLTPVFFYVIEWFLEAPVFSSQGMRRLGRALRFVLNVATLGLPLLLKLLLRGKGRPTTAPAKLPAVRANGVDGHVAAKRDIDRAALDGPGGSESRSDRIRQK